MKPENKKPQQTESLTPCRRMLSHASRHITVLQGANAQEYDSFETSQYHPEEM